MLLGEDESEAGPSEQDATAAAYRDEPEGTMGA